MGFHYIEGVILIEQKRWVDKKKKSFEMVSHLVGNLLKKGCVLDERFPPQGYRSFKDLKSLDPVINAIAFCDPGWLIEFLYKKVGFFFNFEEKRRYSILTLFSNCSSRSRVDENYLNQILELCKLVWDSTNGEKIYAMADYEPYVDAFLDGVGNEEFTIHPSPVWWVEVYGHKLVNKFGKDVLLNIPSYQVEELGDSVLIRRSKFTSADQKDKNYQLASRGIKYFEEKLKKKK